MSAIKEQIALWRAALWAWLMRHAFIVFAVVLACLFLSVVFSGKKTQDVKEVAEQEHQQGVLKDKQVKAKDNIIKAVLDSARQQEVKNKVVAVQRDSAVAAARHHEAKADSALKVLTHEVLPDADATPSRVFERLASYKPGKYAIGDNDSIY